ncbi:MAG: hypothetical protein AB2L14_00095 [Candidatus Xenobiia bacterium LiM19]
MAVKITLLTLLFFAVFLISADTSYAATTGNTAISITIPEVALISMSSSSLTLTINSATAGQQPNEVSDSSLTYSLSTNGKATLSTMKIYGRLDSAVPSNTTLTVTLQAPSGASSTSTVMSATDQPLVTGITRGAYTGLQIQVNFSATVDAGVIDPGITRQLILTLSDT